MNVSVWVGAMAIFAAGFILAIALRRPKPAKAIVEQHPADARVSAETVASFQHTLENDYRQQIESSVVLFGKDLTATSELLSKQVERLTTDVITRELDEYSKTLDQVRKVAVEAAEKIHQTITEQQAGLQKALEETVAAEQERRLGEIDKHLSQIVSSYLVEALGSGVDLGSQTDYIVKSLQAHQADIKKDLARGV